MTLYAMLKKSFKAVDNIFVLTANFLPENKNSIENIAAEISTLPNIVKVEALDSSINIHYKSASNIDENVFKSELSSLATTSGLIDSVKLNKDAYYGFSLQLTTKADAELFNDMLNKIASVKNNTMTLYIKASSEKEARSKVFDTLASIVPDFAFDKELTELPNVEKAASVDKTALHYSLKNSLKVVASALQAYKSNNSDEYLKSYKDALVSFVTAMDKEAAVNPAIYTTITGLDKESFAGSLKAKNDSSILYTLFN